MSSSQRMVLQVFEQPRIPRPRQEFRIAAQEASCGAMPREDVRYGTMRCWARRVEVHQHHQVRYVSAAHAATPFGAGLRRINELPAAHAAAAAARAHLRLVARYYELGLKLSEPWIGIGDDGSLGLDWHHMGRRLAITFEAGGGVEFFAKDALLEKAGPAATIVDQMWLLSWLAHGREFPGQKVDE